MRLVFVAAAVFAGMFVLARRGLVWFRRSRERAIVEQEGIWLRRYLATEKSFDKAVLELKKDRPSAESYLKYWGEASPEEKTDGILARRTKLERSGSLVVLTDYRIEWRESE